MIEKAMKIKVDSVVKRDKFFRNVMFFRHIGYFIADISALFASFFTALLFSGVVNEWILGRDYVEGIELIFDRRASQFFGLSCCLLFIFHMLGQYRRPMPRWTSYKHIIGGTLLMLLADGFLLYAAKEHLSRLWLINSWLLSALYIPLMRYGAKHILDRWDMWAIPTILVGSGPQLEHVRAALTTQPALGYHVIDTVPLARIGESGLDNAWGRLCRDNGGSFVILALSAQEMVEYGELLTDLVRERLPFAVVPSLGGLPILGFEQMSFIGHDFMMMVARNNLGQPFSRGIKFIFDIVVAAILCVLLLPVFALFALAISRDGGPVLYRHLRVGRGGRPFTCLKFRTMVSHAQQVLDAHLAASPAAAAEWEATRKLTDDPRITPIGRFLRSTSLDELPQLLNVMCGQMSLVGPRPVTEDELKYYGRDVFFYLEAMPGMTGLWQVSGRSALSYDQRVLYDTWYVKNWTLWLDVAILVRTIPVVINRDGAV
ncbi:undecaprenyl-phosphate galactose phosphotransferase WbaP [Niveispirillum sp. SYP-B3756]|uniref:undecaprenyl-phosphate galactose phosphotransferase WbaP n=1 Tax=Niveispirillum sp. SYP-B3756 TaxID=2662178 RepID=UPI00129297E3|nr:undecaprenyl-phosphate galactose phosphotransferase WbaP [Niveispirillum sp. SYP-B3756]MQP68443.1 undecaprenyl-phosphate galactose phosphotransferase WbaP [Niveispirillum sp. SYP-B3756]